MAICDIETNEVSYAGKVLKTYPAYAGDTHEIYYALVWDEETRKSASIFLYHTGYGGPYTAIPDATPEITTEYEMYMAALKLEHELTERASKMQQEEEQNILWEAAANKIGISAFKLMSDLNNSTKIRDFLLAKKRSQFKKNLEFQIIDWINSTDRKYHSPLSWKQLTYI